MRGGGDAAKLHYLSTIQTKSMSIVTVVDWGNYKTERTFSKEVRAILVLFVAQKMVCVCW